MQQREIELIESWDPITVRQYQDFYKVGTTVFDDPFDKGDKLLEIVYGLTEEDFSNLEASGNK